MITFFVNTFGIVSLNVLSSLLLLLLQEEAIPELEIDVDELLDMPSDVERGARVKVGHKHKLVSKHARTHRCKRPDIY